MSSRTTSYRGHNVQPSYQEQIAEAPTLDDLCEILKTIEEEAADRAVYTDQLASFDDLPKFGGEPVEYASSWDATRVLESGARRGWVTEWVIRPREAE